MWALRRASTPLRIRGYGVRNSYALGKLGMPHSWEGNIDGSGAAPYISDRCISFEKNKLATWLSSGLHIGSHGLSSQAGAENSGDETEGGFSELSSTSSLEDNKAADESEEGLMSGSELDDDDDIGTQNELDLPEGEAELVETTLTERASLELFKAILNAPSVTSALDEWVSERKALRRADIYLAMRNLRKRRMFVKALEVSEWLDASEQFDFTERDYASRIDLIAKLRGIHKAESYIAQIPESFQGEVVYRSLLANCVVAMNFKKAEQVFNKMKDLGFPITAFACNQLLLLYKRLDKKKLADVLLLMEKENVRPSLFTYRILIDAKGRANDMVGMEQVVDTMKTEGIEPDIPTLAIIARRYTAVGLKEKAMAILKEMEEVVSSKDSRLRYRTLLPLYGELQMEDEVRRVWSICESNPSFEECMAAVIAWGKLKNVPEAEKAFERALEAGMKPSSKQYSTMMKVYADNKMPAKGKDLAKQMEESGIKMGPLMWDALVKIYVEAGEAEKADSFLQKALERNRNRPLFATYMVIMDHYSSKGDIHNAERIFHRMRQWGYVARFTMFQSLVQAYINAKMPAYGMRERLKADNLFPNRDLAGKLAKIDAFRRTPMSDLFD